MIDINKFAALQKASHHSFVEQKLLVKKVVAGKKVLCTICHQPLYLLTPPQAHDNSDENSGIRCKKGCTDLQLDFA